MSGLKAFFWFTNLGFITYWVIRRDFDPTWWIPNLYLMIYPLFFLKRFIKLEVRS